MPQRIQLEIGKILQWFGWVGAVFAVSLFGWALYAFSGEVAWPRSIFFAGIFIAGSWLFFRAFRIVAKLLIWRLRHRLIVTYLFIAVAPVVLLAVLGLMAGYLLVSQVAMNVVTTELERREAELNNLTATIVKLDPATRAPDMERILSPYFTDRYPGLNAVLHQQNGTDVFPPRDALPALPTAAAPAHGIVSRSGEFFLWASRPTPDGGITLMAPLTHEMLDALAPEFGLIDVAAELDQLRRVGPGTNRPLPAAVNAYDRPLVWFATLSANSWENPTQATTPFVIALETRVFTAISAIFGRQADTAQGLIAALLIAGMIVFLLVEIICWVIGVSMTRTITGAVHHLYEGTQMVTEGHLSHRIEVAGKDQLADVGTSFNRMTAHLEHLVAVEKEKERLQSDLEIAHEVQSQLYPRIALRSPHLTVAAVCRPARTVSGDYFDYASIRPGSIAFAIGDVAGKGISAALLMASLQSSLRTQLQVVPDVPSSSAIVTRLNRHICASSTPNKYATFCLGLYDETTHVLLYTNAGHLPPALIRKGTSTRLDVNGTVVGCFPNAAYEESCVSLEPGDLLLWFTDGISELENAFGEMYGEDRLIDLVAKNSHLSEQRIVDLILEAAREWSDSDEMQDDLTLLLLRRT